MRFVLARPANPPLGLKLGKKVEVAIRSCYCRFLRRLRGWLSHADPSIFGDVERRVVLMLDCCTVELDRDKLPVASNVTNNVDAPRFFFVLSEFHLLDWFRGRRLDV